MSELKIREELMVKVVDYYDFDELVNATYKSETFTPNYEFVAEKECANDTSHLFEGISLTPKYKWSYSPEVKDKIEKWALGQAGRYDNPTTNELLFDLCARGLVDEGNYLIQVSW